MTKYVKIILREIFRQKNSGRGGQDSPFLYLTHWASEKKMKRCMLLLLLPPCPTTDCAHLQKAVWSERSASVLKPHLLPVSGLHYCYCNIREPSIEANAGMTPKNSTLFGKYSLYIEILEVWTPLPSDGIPACYQKAKQGFTILDKKKENNYDPAGKVLGGLRKTSVAPYLPDDFMLSSVCLSKYLFLHLFTLPFDMRCMFLGPLLCL